MSSPRASPQLMNGLVRSSYDGTPLRRASREDQSGVRLLIFFVNI